MAKSAIMSGAIFVTTEVFAEVTYVLNRVYAIERNDIANILLGLITLVSTDDTAVMKLAFSYYAETKLDFVDCILAAYHHVHGVAILTFDKKLNNFIKRQDSLD
jgi:predicted nucleic-acid-binding protein